MIAIQADESGHPVVVEIVNEDGKSRVKPVDTLRWREIVVGEIDLDETPRAIVPVQAAIETACMSCKCEYVDGPFDLCDSCKG